MADHPSNRPEDIKQVYRLFDTATLNDRQVTKVQAILDGGSALAETIFLCCPDCADRTDAIRKVRESVMTANAAIALEARPADGPGHPTPSTSKVDCSSCD